MLIVHLSDLHLGRRAPGDDLGAERLNTLRAALVAAAEHSPQAIVVAGDVFDGPEVDPGVVQAAARALDRARDAHGEPVPVVVIPGNHDPADASALWRRFVDSLSADTSVRVVLQPERLTLADGRLSIEAYPCLSRYSPEPPWSTPIAGPAAGDGVLRVVMAHGTLEGGPVPEGESDAYPFTMADAAALGADYVALGHFHGIYPPWNGGDEIVRAVSYCGTHEPDQFGSDAGWALLVNVEPGRPARLRRLRVGRCEWCSLGIDGPADLDQLKLLADKVESDLQPSRFCVRIKVSASLRLSPGEASQLEAMLSGLRAVGARVDQNGELRACVNVESLDFDALPAGALRQSLLSLREEWGAAAGEEREILAAALQLGWEQCQGRG